MNKFWLAPNLAPFYSPEDVTGLSPELPVLDDVDFLEEGSEDKPVGSEEVSDDEIAEDKEIIEDEDEEGDGTDEDDEPDEDDEDEENEDDEEDSDKDDEVKDEIFTDGKISVKALKEDFPEIFKKHPGLKDVIFKEREFSKVYGSVDDAKEAATKAETFDNFEATLLNGGIGEILDAVAEQDSNAAVKLAENFLPELYQRSKQVFAKVTIPVVKNVLRSTFTRANNQGNKQLALACKYISRDLFEEADVLKATSIEEEQPDPRAEEINREKAKLFEEKKLAANDEIVGNVKARLSKDITSKLGSNLSDFVREALTEKILSELNITLTKDKAYMNHLSSLWKKMAKAGFPAEAKSKITSASLARARQVLPAVIAKVKAQQKKPSEKKVVKQEPKAKVIPGQRSSKASRERSPGKLDRSMSDYEFLSK